MGYSRGRPVIGFLSLTLVALTAYLLIQASADFKAGSAFHLNLIASSTFIFNIAILLGWISLGPALGTALTALAVFAAVAAAARAGLYGYAAFAAIPVLTSLAGYACCTRLSRIDSQYELRSEKLDEEINLIRSSIRDKKTSIAVLDEKLHRYALLRDAANLFSTTLALADINALIVREALAAVNKSGRVLLYIVDNAKQELILQSVKHDRSHAVASKRGDIFDTWVLRYRKSLIVEDVAKDYRFSLNQGGAPKKEFTSLIATPLMSEDKVIGILRMDAPAEAVYTQDDLRLMDIVAGLGAVAIQNALLYTKTQELAIRDGLTGLFLRRYFLERFKQEVKRASRRHENFSLLILDIDHFKETNDQFGHMAGDLVLKHLADMVASSARPGDIIARYGGEEIAILLAGAGKSDALAEAEAVRKKIEATPLNLRRHDLRTTVSIGLSVYPDDAALEEELIMIADERLYKAKAEGRNRVCAA